ncbi:MAG TPA: hypothetical protein VFZ14_01115 [Burkholderiales bacterium]|nr:hypothetical protein [Burkholderiales bacterium]
MAAHYVMHFDSVAELHRIDDLRARFEPAQSSPPVPGAQAELVDHREHSVAGQTSFRAIGPMAHGGEARLDRFGLFRLPRGPLPNFEVLNDCFGETRSAGWGRMQTLV